MPFQTGKLKQWPNASDLRYISIRQYIDTFFMYHNTILWYKNIDTGHVILILKSRVLNKMSGNYGHKMNTEITDKGNDDGAGTPGIESAAENEDNTTRTSHSTHSHYIPLPGASSGAKSKVWKYFAFEADDDNKILNNSVVICQVESYNMRIGYLKNVTNLLLHLKRHHPTQHSEIPARS